MNGNDILIRKNSDRFQLFLLSNCIGFGMLGYVIMSHLYSKIMYAIYSSLDYETSKILSDSSIFQNSTYIIYALFCVVLPFVSVYLLTKRICDIKLLFNKPKKGRGLLPVTFIGLGMCILGNYCSSIFSWITENLFSSTPTGAPSDITSASQISLAGFLVSIVSTAIVPALVEEFALRGVVMQSLRKFGDKFAVVISAIVFSIIHANFEQIPFALVCGLALGYVVIRTNSIWAGVLLHFLNNFWAVCSEYLSYLVPYECFAVAYIIISVVLCAAAIISAVYLYKKDVREGITSGVLKESEGSLNLFERVLFICYSPAFMLGAGYLIYSALQNFVAV